MSTSEATWAFALSSRVLSGLLGGSVLAVTLLAHSAAQAANVTGVYGSYGGYWPSASGAINATVPDDSNLLLGFTTSAGTFSTGVNDSALSANSVSFSPQVFRALPVPGVTQPLSTGSNVIGIASHWGGVDQAAAYPGGDVPSNAGRPLSYYLDDGTQGLEMATAVFNIPTANTLRVAINGAGITNAVIGDGVPDIVLTQTGDPAGSETLGFYDASGNLVGTALSVSFGSVASVGRQRWAFYNAGTLGERFAINGTRDLRLLAYDFTDFGITAANAAQIASFRQILSGNADSAFIAYNANSLPVVPPELALAKTASALTAGANGSYTLTLSNQSTLAATSGTITVTDTLPAGITPTTAGGTGWTCSIAAQTVTCTSFASVAAGASAAAITIDVAVSATAPASVTNTAVVSGGGDTACPAQPRCTGTVTSTVVGGGGGGAGGTVAAVPVFGLPGLLLTSLGVGLLGWRRRHR
ncbi:MAG: hypothetical protein Q4F13_10285 [Pseudomonadota bacterium]|nr:hypothetical protein [Pseudomonadota bacterium]